MGALVFLVVGCLVFASTANGADVRVRQEQKSRGVRKHSPTQVALEVDDKGGVSSSTHSGTFHLVWTDLAIGQGTTYSYTQLMGSWLGAVLLAGSCYEGITTGCPESHLGFTLPVRTSADPKFIVTFASTRYSSSEACRLTESGNAVSDILGMNVSGKQIDTSGGEDPAQGYCQDNKFWRGWNGTESNTQGCASFDLMAAKNLNDWTKYNATTEAWDSSRRYSRNLTSVTSTSIDVLSNAGSSASSEYGAYWAWSQGYNGNALFLANSNKGFDDGSGNTKLITGFKDGLTAAQTCDMVRLKKEVFGLTQKSDVVVLCPVNIQGAKCRSLLGSCSELEMVIWEFTGDEDEDPSNISFQQLFGTSHSDTNITQATTAFQNAKYLISHWSVYNKFLLYHVNGVNAPSVTHVELGEACVDDRPRKANVSMVCPEDVPSVALSAGQISGDIPEADRPSFRNKILALRPLLDQITGTPTVANLEAHHSDVQYFYNTIMRLLKVRTTIPQGKTLKQTWDDEKNNGNFAWNVAGGGIQFKFANATGKYGEVIYTLACAGTSTTCSCSSSGSAGTLKCDGSSSADEKAGSLLEKINKNKGGSGKIPIDHVDHEADGS